MLKELLIISLTVFIVGRSWDLGLNKEDVCLAKNEMLDIGCKARGRKQLIVEDVFWKRERNIDSSFYGRVEGEELHVMINVSELGIDQLGWIVCYADDKVIDQTMISIKHADGICNYEVDLFKSQAVEIQYINQYKWCWENKVRYGFFNCSIGTLNLAHNFVVKKIVVVFKEGSSGEEIDWEMIKEMSFYQKWVIEGKDEILRKNWESEGKYYRGGQKNYWTLYEGGSEFVCDTKYYMREMGKLTYWRLEGYEDMSSLIEWHVLDNKGYSYDNMNISLNCYGTVFIGGNFKNWL